MRFLLTALSLLASTSALALDPLELSESEFKMFRHYQLAEADARVQAMKPEKRLAAIAKDAGFKVKDLEKAISRGQAAGDVKSRCEGNLKEVLAASTLAKRLGRVEVDTSAAHAVTYVQWFNSETNALPVEASEAAARAAKACPIASTITVWANSGADKKQRVFQAMIATSAADRINVDKVKDFAETRYIRLFEKVKRLDAGDDMSDEAGTAAAQH